MTADTWFHIFELVGGIPLFTKMLFVLIDIRDQSRDVGHREPPTGLFKRVEDVEAVAQESKETLIDMRARLGFKRATDSQP